MNVPPINPANLAWLYDSRLPTPSPEVLCTLVDQRPLLSGMLDPVDSLRRMGTEQDIADLTTLALSRAFADRLAAFGPSRVDPVRRLWARQSRPAQRAQLLFNGGLAASGAWWNDASFAAEACGAVEVTRITRDQVQFMSGSFGQMRRHLDGSESSQWPTGTWIRLWSIVFDWTVPVADAAAAHDLAFAALDGRVASGHWQPTAEDLLPLLRSKDAGIRVWAQCALAAVPSRVGTPREDPSVGADLLETIRGTPGAPRHDAPRSRA